MPDRITSGVVFTTPPSLPRGRHVLSRDEVTAAQRERMLIAATELLAGAGYRGFGVREICSRAAVSRAAFYACFADKDACVYAAYDRFIAVFLGHLADSRASGSDWAGCVHGFVASYLTTLQRDLVAARAFQVEMDALGRAARERRRAALTELAGFVRDLRFHRFPGTAGAVPFSAYLGAIHALRQAASDALDAEPEPDLSALADELTPWLCRMVEAPHTPHPPHTPHTPKTEES
ncbi:putative TetR-family transcriptional regulator [Actinoplanes missouriensis 431]|uniref:Putative TetR-family transcriptional regulator n=1 Tax=Actinoplanes missouriensis (strain ATCC 14538 / DSM 43046 / CBS 188.64 / JCM 3121 / NBRC 102363 / NCIMB 12654 / NRRL B-3342 / UNCC 431) TaxID=512565 RepID=I0HC22_ACTM4|nr:TetR/AcrR family transcriptional regulator [Actinoplanes missouriensis]BAL90559.1 putative TetR-family transcriptional regulator [Actinoplanes missouriensis 431]